jgi:hypothetical protein
VQEYVAKNKMAVVSHPLYSPHLALPNFFLFPKMKIKLKGKDLIQFRKFMQKQRW